jgi:ADP-dependent NAD(P)H-hydrate dehydratase / NAD(P)H-hydrate epimerase
MRLATVGQSQEIEELSVKAYGLTAEVLMESAGALAAREIDQSYFPELARGMTAVVCGPGNNGGDGLVVARHLHSMGHRDLMVITLAPEESQSVLFKLQLERVKRQGIRVVHLSENPEKMEQLRSCELIVDGLFGIGLSRRLEGEFSHLVDVMNSTKTPIVALDCPSGLHCDTGRTDGSAVRATMTTTFGLAKPGFFVAEGPHHVGKLKVLSIGFPYEALRGVATSHFLFTEKLARRYLPARHETSNKSDHGHLLLLAGHEGMWGAGLLAAGSAYRLGVGYVTWSSFASPDAAIKDLPEVLMAEWQGRATWESRKITAIAIGPGLGVNEGTAGMLRDIKDHFKGPVVVDADAITVAVEHGLLPLPKNWIITPHMGELARVLKMEAREMENDRFNAALKGAEAAGCHVLLKGFRSIHAFENRCMVIHSGNSALAKAGTGDVLTGMIGSFLAQGMETLQAAATAAYIHGRMADEWVRLGHDKRSLSASDVRDHLPQILTRIAGGAIL